MLPQKCKERGCRRFREMNGEEVCVVYAIPEKDGTRLGVKTVYQMSQKECRTVRETALNSGEQHDQTDVFEHVSSGMGVDDEKVVEKIVRKGGAE